MSSRSKFITAVTVLFFIMLVVTGREDLLRLYGEAPTYVMLYTVGGYAFLSLATGGILGGALYEAFFAGSTGSRASAEGRGIEDSPPFGRDD
jgi:hypothetical protein